MLGGFDGTLKKGQMANKSNWQWSNGERVNFDGWNECNPNNVAHCNYITGANRMCMTWTTGKWSDVGDIAKGFVVVEYREM